MRFDSRAVHSGRDLKARDPLGPPIVQTAAYVFDDLEDYDAVAAGREPGHIYGRNSNENAGWLEVALADLEGAEAAVATGSGMAATLIAILALAPRPVPIVVQRDLYGVTTSLLRLDFEPAGYELRPVEITDLNAVEAALPGAGLLVCETISNPLCKVPDLTEICRMAAGAGVPVLVDNTFATPVICRPLEFGAGLVVHSVTKFIGGHSDLTAGVVVGPGSTIAGVRARAIRMGTTLGPFEAWLALRGVRTLGLRVRRQSDNAQVLAGRLASLSEVDTVHYPLLEGSPYEAVARRHLAAGAGGMLAFDLGGGGEAVQAMLSRLQMARFAASLGGVETTISYPEIASHRGLDAGERLDLGILPGTVRVSTGIEDPADITADFTQAITARR